MTGTDIARASPVTQYPIPAITVPGRMRYSRHKRSGISYGCHNESPRTTVCGKISLAYRRSGEGVCGKTLLP